MLPMSLPKRSSIRASQTSAIAASYRVDSTRLALMPRWKQCSRPGEPSSLGTEAESRSVLRYRWSKPPGSPSPMEYLRRPVARQVLLSDLEEQQVQMPRAGLVRVSGRRRRWVLVSESKPLEAKAQLACRRLQDCSLRAAVSGRRFSRR